MIIKTLCNSCFQTYDILVDPSETHLIKDVMDGEGQADCPRGCGGRVLLDGAAAAELVEMMKDRRLRDPLPITAKELYRAIHGGGLPDEIPKSYELGVALFGAHRVKRVFMEQDGKNIYLHQIHFEDGSVMHLTAGLRGAQVLKITKEA